MGEFQSVNYKLLREDGQEGLVINAKPNELGPYFVRFGVQLSTDFKNESNWAILAGFRATRVNALGAEWKTDIEVGLNRRLYTEFYQPLGAHSRWFVAPWGDYFNLREDIYDPTGREPPTGCAKGPLAWTWGSASASTESCAWDPNGDA